MIFFLVLLWLLVQLVMLAYFGIRTGSDTEIYVNTAHALLEGNFPEGRLRWYSTYIALLAAVFALGGSLGWVVGIQIILSGLAAAFLWKAVLKLSGDLRISFVAVFLYLAWAKIHQWNIFVYTESLFTSLSLIAFGSWLLSRKSWQYGLSVLLIVVTFFVRPTGFSFLAGWLLFGLAVLPVKKSWKWTAVVPVLVVSLLLLDLMLKDFILIASYARAEIIYPDINMGVTPPDDLQIPEDSSRPLERLLLFVWYNSGYFIKISLIKLFLFFGNVKPYFSLLHNLLIVLLLYPLYFFAILGYRRLPNACHAKYFMLGFILVQACTVALTSENWDGRFLVPVLPFVFILSAVGITGALTKKPLPFPEEVQQ